MPTLSATSSVSQSGFQQLQLQQARRNADQAEQSARSLRSQADSAQRVASRAQEGARLLSVEAGQAQDRAGQARQGVVSQESLARTSAQIGEIHSRVAEKFLDDETPQVVSAAPVVVNTQGQVTDGNVNVTA